MLAVLLMEANTLRTFVPKSWKKHGDLVVQSGGSITYLADIMLQ